MIVYALLAQLDRVFGYEPKGQGFESLAARQPQFLVNQGVAVFFILGFSAEKTRFSNRFLTIRRIRPLKMYDGLKISLAFLDCEEYNFYVRNKADIGVKK